MKRFHLFALAFVLGVSVKAAAQDGTFTTIDFPGATAFTIASGINPRGDIVGFYSLRADGSIQHGFLLRRRRGQSARGNGRDDDDEPDDRARRRQ